MYSVIILSDIVCLSLMLLLRCAGVQQAVYQYDKLAYRKWQLVIVGQNNDLWFPRRAENVIT
jgi:hypothetical protein